MTILVDAVFQDGVLKPKQPIALPEGSEVEVTIATKESSNDPLAAVIGIGDGPENGDVADRHDDYLYER